MSQGKVEICGVNTAKLPLLSSEEKEVLFRKDKPGGFTGQRSLY